MFKQIEKNCQIYDNLIAWKSSSFWEPDHFWVLPSLLQSQILELYKIYFLRKDSILSILPLEILFVIIKSILQTYTPPKHKSNMILNKSLQFIRSIQF